MGYVDYFLGTTFTWIKHKEGNISIHIRQSEFTEFTAHQFSVHSANKVPKMTPYSSEFPIYYIPPVETLYPDLPLLRQVHQIIFGCINWIATCKRPDIAPDITFIASYRNPPHPQYYKAAVHALKYLTSTNEYVISFQAQYSSTIQEFKHFPHHHDKEAYT